MIAPASKSRRAAVVGVVAIFGGAVAHQRIRQALHPLPRHPQAPRQQLPAPPEYPRQRDNVCNGQG
ncbi:MAG: hypothetical protein ACRD04_14335 [Terriglobales bacterium]